MPPASLYVPYLHHVYVLHRCSSFGWSPSVSLQVDPQLHDCIIQLPKRLLLLLQIAGHDTFHIQQTCNWWWEGWK